MASALLLIDHGSRRTEANEMLACVARLVQQQAGDHVIVRYAHMELAAPTVAEGFESCVEAGAQEVVVHPYFLGRGRHVREDIPRLVAAAAAAHPEVAHRVTEPLGLHPLLGQVVLERAGFPLQARVEAADPARPGSGCTRRPDTCSEPWCSEP